MFVKLVNDGDRSMFVDFVGEVEGVKNSEKDVGRAMSSIKHLFVLSGSDVMDGLDEKLTPVIRAV